MNQVGANVLTTGEVAKYLKVHRSTVMRLLARGEIPAFRAGSRGDWRFDAESVARFTERTFGGGQ